MAIGTKSDFKIYNEQFYGGQMESIVQAINGFNQASNGAILLSSKNIKGDYQYESFINDLGALIQRRDPTLVTAVTDMKVTQGETISVKLNRRIGPAAQTLDAWKKIAVDPEEFSLKMGQAIGVKKTQEMLNTAIAAASAAISGVAANTTTVSASGKLSFQALVNMLAMMGDQSDRIVAWVMHSKPWFDLVGQAITDKVYGVANVAIFEGTTGSLGRPVIVTDAPALKISSGGSAPTYTYATLGLTSGAAEVEESEEQTIESQMVTGLANLVMRIQGEYAYNLGVKGFTYDATNGGANPDDSTVATSSNWDKVVTFDKNVAGVRTVST